jgi:diguanylate cyclase (GGDEF)-like protein
VSRVARYSAIGIKTARYCVLSGLIALVLMSPVAVARDAGEIDALLAKLDDMKTSNYLDFKKGSEELHAEFSSLSEQQQEVVTYFIGWQQAYEGNYDGSISTLTQLANKTQDVVLKFRAIVTTVNALSIARRYDDAFTKLNVLLELLPYVKDANARQQGLGVTALLYNVVGEYRFGLEYAQKLIDESGGGKGACRGEQLRLEALFRSRQLTKVDSQFQSGLKACVDVQEVIHANLIRTYMARAYMDQHRPGEAIELLNEYLLEVNSTHYKFLISEFSALLATAYRDVGETTVARRFAMAAVANTKKGEYTEPLINAHRLLYVIAKEQGDSKAALSYLEDYASADKGYLDDVTARQLAYQRIKQEVEAGKLQIDALNKQNEVLQLQRALSQKAVENIRLYIALLTAIILFIALWAYKTKRSQMHFKKLSRRDGLTGIFNRPHFIELSETTLKNARKTGQDVCVVLCDLDHFKSVNDTYGHAEGDYVLQRAVTACQMHLRATDVFARIGGEEFGLLLPGCNIEDARGRVERLRIAVSESNLSDGKFKVSASFGISCSNSSGYELQTLMTHADAALYQAKRSGRNCVVAYDAKDPAINGPRVVYVDGVKAS